MFDGDPTAVELGLFVAQPPHVVWRALTEVDLVERWFARTTGFTAKVGSSFIFEIPADPPAEIACQVIAAESCRRFTHSYTDLRGEAPARWVVDWLLIPQGKGTRILLTHSGFDVDQRQQKMARNVVERGWQNDVLPKLENVLDGIEL